MPISLLTTQPQALRWLGSLRVRHLQAKDPLDVLVIHAFSGALCRKGRRSNSSAQLWISISCDLAVAARSRSRSPTQPGTDPSASPVSGDTASSCAPLALHFPQALADLGVIVHQADHRAPGRTRQRTAPAGHKPPDDTPAAWPRSTRSGRSARSPSPVRCAAPAPEMWLETAGRAGL